MAWVEIPAPADVVQDRAGNRLLDLPCSLKIAGVNVTHAADTEGTDQQTGGLMTLVGGGIGIDGERRFIQSGTPVDLTVTLPNGEIAERLLQPTSASAESEIAGAAQKAEANVFTEAQRVDADGTIIGNRTTSVPVGSLVALEVADNVVNPNETIMQHLVGFNFYSGAPGPNCGSLQGGSCESQVYADTGDWSGEVALGFEAIGHGSGDNGEVIGTIIGGQDSAFVEGNITVTTLIGHSVAPVRSISGSPAVTTAIGLRVEAPTIGTTKYSAKITGRTHLTAVASTNPFEIGNVSDTLQWAVDSSMSLRGFASDGASSRIILDPLDGATYRARFIKQQAANVNLRLDSVPAPSGNFLEVGIDTSTIAFSIDSAAIPRWNATANQQTTVGAAGGASALPATPTKYLKVKDSAGTVLVVPCYAAS